MTQNVRGIQRPTSLQQEAIKLTQEWVGHISKSSTVPLRKNTTKLNQPAVLTVDSNVTIHALK